MLLHILLTFVIQNGVLSETNVNKWASLKQSSEFLKIINKVLNTEKYDKFFYVDLDSKDIPLDQYYEGKNEKIENKLINTENANAHVYSANGVRLHLIKNPEVLYKYQKKIEDRLRNVKYDPSKGKSKAAFIQDILTDLRRNAVYRLDKTSGESNNLNEDQSREDLQYLKSHRKHNVAPLIFITEEPNKYDKSKDLDYKKRSDLPKWDDYQYSDDKNIKSKYEEKENKYSKDDNYSSKNDKKEYKKKMNDNDDYKLINDGTKDVNDDYERKNDDFKREHDEYKRKNDEIKNENDEYKRKNDDFKREYDDYKRKNNNIKRGNDIFEYENDNFRHKNDDTKHKNDDYKFEYDDKKPKKDDYKPHDDYKPYQNNDYDSNKPKNNHRNNYKSKNVYRPHSNSYKSDYAYRPKKVERSGGGSVFGRTPIPHRGRKVVYEE